MTRPPRPPPLDRRRSPIAGVRKAYAACSRRATVRATRLSAAASCIDPACGTARSQLQVALCCIRTSGAPLRLRQPLLPYNSSPSGNDWSVPMVLPHVSPELAARLANYTIDDRAREIIRRLGPLLEPHIAEAINEVVVGAERLAQVADVYRKHGADFLRIESAQFSELLKADFGDAYLERCRATTEQEAALGFEGRARMNSAGAVLRVWTGVLKRKNRFATAKFAEEIHVLSHAAFFDLATTSTFYLQRVRAAASARRKAIDDAIGDFDSAIGGVIGALKEATGSLTTTSATVQNVTEDTRRRMASASNASTETSQS